MTFDEAFNALLQHEGGFSNHDADPGGATRFGITEAVARAEGFTGDMREYPIAEARRVYRRLYWDVMRLDEVPADLRFVLFDAAVNSGVTQATRWCQTLCGTRRDGRMGPATLQALQTVDLGRFLGRFAGQRLKFMTELPTWPTFGRGWARRIADNLLR